MRDSFRLAPDLFRYRNRVMETLGGARRRVALPLFVCRSSTWRCGTVDCCREARTHGEGLLRFCQQRLSRRWLRTVSRQSTSVMLIATIVPGLVAHELPPKGARGLGSTDFRSLRKLSAAPTRGSDRTASTVTGRRRRDPSSRHLEWSHRVRPVRPQFVGCA